jgi:hypothetical protein
MKVSCIGLINVCSYVVFAEIVGVSILFLIAWAYAIFCLPSVVWDEARFPFPRLDIFVK